MHVVEAERIGGKRADRGGLLLSQRRSWIRPFPRATAALAVGVAFADLIPP
jgi:hypothetical protein